MCALVKIAEDVCLTQTSPEDPVTIDVPVRLDLLETSARLTLTNANRTRVYEVVALME